MLLGPCKKVLLLDGVSCVAVLQGMYVCMYIDSVLVGPCKEKWCLGVAGSEKRRSLAERMAWASSVSASRVSESRSTVPGDRPSKGLSYEAAVPL